MSQDCEPTLYLHGIGHFHPENRLDNIFFESLQIDTNNEWILERVGIKSRRTVLNLDYILKTKNRNPKEARSNSVYSNEETGAKASLHAMQRAKINERQIGLVISGSCSPEHLIPCEASKVANALNIKAPCFDLNSACSSFVAQIDLLRKIRPEQTPDYILIVQPENNTRVVDYADRNTAVLWGDASTAAVVSLKIKSPVEIAFSFIESDPSGWNKVLTQTGSHFQQIGSHVQSFAIRKTSDSITRIKEYFKEQSEEMYFIGHQANLSMLNAIATRNQISDTKHLHNVENYGNCGAAGAPSVLSENWGLFKKGDCLGMAVVGSGLTWGGACFYFKDRVVQ